MLSYFALGHWLKCPHCEAVFWLCDVEPVGQRPGKPYPLGRWGTMWAKLTGDRKGRLRELREWDALPAGWKAAEYVKRPDYFDLEPGLRQEGLAPDKELLLRRTLWWHSNDHQRVRTDGFRKPQVPVTSDEFSRVNKLRMLDLHAQLSTGDCVEQGELLRQLGRFDEAVKVLAAVKLDGRSEVTAVKIQRWAQAREAGLMEFNR
jgi:hypothetical protein